MQHNAMKNVPGQDNQDKLSLIIKSIKLYSSPTLKFLLVLNMNEIKPKDKFDK